MMAYKTMFCKPPAMPVHITLDVSVYFIWLYAPYTTLRAQGVKAIRIFFNVNRMVG